MAHATDHDSHRRNRDDEAESSQRSRQSSQPQGPVGLINYLPRADQLPLVLLQGDADTFADVLSVVGKYEGALERRESLAANLGAKLTGPRLLRGFDNFFVGPITVISQPHYATVISWSDVVVFAKGNPDDFKLSQQPNGTRRCQFTCKGCQVEISEDDWRLISSGALDGLKLEQSFEEDELSELATLDILEQRASVLYKKADEVAARARILHHKLGQRKQEISRRRKSQNAPAARHQGRMSSFGSSYDLHADLLQQFVAASALISQSRSTSGAGLPLTPVGQQSPSMPIPFPPRQSSSFSRPPTGANTSTDQSAPTAIDALVDTYRTLITQKTDKLLKGDDISPPCDRCRRLRCPCVKHLTACQGCTKKHAKCSWKSITEDEISRLRQEMGVAASGDVDMDAVAEPRLPPWGGGPRVFQFTANTSVHGHADDAARPESREEGTATPTSVFARGHNANSGFELAPIKNRVANPNSSESDNAPLPRLNDHSLGHIANIAAQATQETHHHQQHHQHHVRENEYYREGGPQPSPA